jgi:acetyltransferase-like isoleucine patch superfamily enzyme/lysophospholipase L1-like esterase
MTTIDAGSVAGELVARLGDGVRIGAQCELAPDLCVEIDRGSRLVLGDRVSIRRGTTLQVHPGATIVIGDDVAIGDNVFLSAMVGIRIGDGVGISNMVDIHDHNHRDRSRPHVPDGQLVPWASGFDGAPVIIGSGAVLSNKVSVTAGVRVGQNSLIGANAVVTRSIAPNTVAAGVPARPIRTFDGPLRDDEDRHTVLARWFGTSIMEHYEGFNARLFNQADLPPVGSTVVVEKWRQRGYVQQLHLCLQAAWPYLDFSFDNRGQGGATSRDVLRVVQEAVEDGSPPADLAFLGCGINDVWRGFQGRAAETVGRPEFAANYRQAVRLLAAHARQVICIAETPFGWDADLDVPAMNAELLHYNEVAAGIAAEESAGFLDVWPAFTRAAAHLAAGAPATALWSDGVHLSELGDALMLQLVDEYLRDNGIVSMLTTYRRLERTEARMAYRHLFADVRADLE